MDRVDLCLQLDTYDIKIPWWINQPIYRNIHSGKIKIIVLQECPGEELDINSVSPDFAGWINKCFSG